MTVSALTLFVSQAISAAETTAPVHAQDDASREKSDTLVYSATKSLIESFGELSKTASKLSETALKLLEAQESLDNKKNSDDRRDEDKRIQDRSVDSKARMSQSEQLTETEIIQEQLTEPIPAPESKERIPSQQITPHATTVIRDTVYMTVTDTIYNHVVIQHEENPAPAKYPLNLNEMTYWRGDSIPMALPTKRLGRFDRKLYNWLIYPKGLWHIGLNANYGELSTDDSEFLSLIQDVDLKGKIYSIKPSVSYFLRNNLCVGIRLAFTKGEMGINSFKVDIDEDMSFDLHDIKYSSDSYAAAVFIQQYFGLSRRGRFAVFNEAEVSIGSGNSHFVRPFDGNIRDTRTKTQTFNINYSPGVSIMMMKNAAFNLSFGIFGFHLKDEKQWENGEESGSRFTSGINFRFNLFNINFGVSVII